MARCLVWVCIGVTLLAVFPAWSKEKSADPQTTQFEGASATKKKVGEAGEILKGTWEITLEAFSEDLSLKIALGEVILLVILANIFALFKKARLILAVSYLFCLKWVFWSNYTLLLEHSDTLTYISSIIFLVCGLLTLTLFCLDRFNKP